MKVGLQVVQRINAITLKRTELISELKRRESEPIHPRVGAWRHEWNLAGLRMKIELLEKQRTILFERYKKSPN